MQILLVSLSILITLFFTPVVLAQSSPFKNLTGTPTSLRLFESINDLTLQDYLSTKENYGDLLELHERAFGARKIELEDQILARSKDIQFAKLGATKTYLNTLSTKLTDSKRAAAETLTFIEGMSNSYSNSADLYREQIESALSVTEVIEVANSIKGETDSVMIQVTTPLAVLSVGRGEVITDLIEFKSEVIQAHLLASAGLGGDIGEAQILFEDSMIALEEAKDIYKSLDSLVGDGSLVSASAKDLRNLLDTSTKKMRTSSEGLNEVIGFLRILYSQSPWEIDTAKFEIVGEKLTEEIPEGGEVGNNLNVEDQ